MNIPPALLWRWIIFLNPRKVDKIQIMYHWKWSKIIYGILIFVAAWLGAGCQHLPFADVLFKSTQPTATVAEAILYFDDFSDPNSGWDRTRSEEGFTDYEEGSYHIFVNESITDYFATPYRTYSDVRLEVDAIRMAGPVENTFGLICRFGDERNFYLGLIGSDGYYGIFKVQDGEYLQMDNDFMRTSEAILQDAQAINSLRFDCHGKQLVLYVNGFLLAAAENEAYKSGDIGLLAGSFEQPGVLIAFDNFRILDPNAP